MSALLRVTLVAALLLFAGGVGVAPHVDPPGHPALHVDHVPGALRLAVFTHFARFFRIDGPALRSVEPESSLAAAATAALVAIAWPRAWRPGRLGVRRLIAAVASPQWRGSPPHDPPRPSFGA